MHSKQDKAMLFLRENHILSSTNEAMLNGTKFIFRIKGSKNNVKIL